MNSFFADRVCIVTWASDGLWKAVTQKLLLLGATVVGIAKTAEKLSLVQKEFWDRFHWYCGDLSDAVSLDNLYTTILTEHNKVDILVNNAAIWYEWGIEEHSLAVLQSLLMANVFSTMGSIHKVFPIMKKHGWWQILNVNSIAWIDVCKERSPYAGTKYAIDGYSKWLSHEAAEHNIKVMQIYPWWMDTNIFESFQSGYGKHDWMMDKEKVADLIVMMLSQPQDMCIDSLVVRKFG